MRPSNGIRVAPAGKKGRGVFATKQFLPDDLIERAPVVILEDEDDIEAIEETMMGNYWYSTDHGQALALGYASLYNHSYRPNAQYAVNEDTETISIVAIHKIKPGKEITINYNGDPNSKTKFDFSGKAYKAAEESEEDKKDESILHYYDVTYDNEDWSWCGKSDIHWTGIPKLVNCPDCIKGMTEVKNQLKNWEPDRSRKKQLNKHGTRVGLRYIAAELVDRGMHMDASLLEDLEAVVGTLPASTFPGYKPRKSN
jgi:hypothetical protein